MHAPGPSRAAALLAFAERIAKHRTGRRAVHVHLSRLLGDRPRHHVAIAVAVFETAVQGLEGELFQLDDNDLVFVGSARESKSVEAGVQKLQYLLQGGYVDPEAEPVEEFATWYELDIRYDAFLEHARALAVAESRRRQRARDTGAEAAGQARRRALDLAELASLERALASADISSIVREQAICVVDAAMRPKRVLTELYTSIGELSQLLAPGLDLTENRLLFQYLTRVIDVRMLAHLRAPGGSPNRYLSINMNVGSVLSQTFLAFESNLPLGLRGKIVLEFHAADVFSDLRAFFFARDFVHQQGYRLCLDGVVLPYLPFVARKALGFDLVKLNCDDELRAAMGGRAADSIRAEVQSVGGCNMILHRCESEADVRLGQTLGIQMAQGHYLDALVPLHERSPQAASPAL